MVAQNRFTAVAARPTPASETVQASPAREWKYTIKLSTATRTLIDEDVRRLADQTGLLVDRRHVTIALYEALHADESLFAEVKRRVTSMFEDKTAGRPDGQTAEPQIQASSVGQ